MKWKSVIRMTWGVWLAGLSIYAVFFADIWHQLGFDFGMSIWHWVHFLVCSGLMVILFSFIKSDGFDGLKWWNWGFFGMIFGVNLLLLFGSHDLWLLIQVPAWLLIFLLVLTRDTPVNRFTGWFPLLVFLSILSYFISVEWPVFIQMTYTFNFYMAKAIKPMVLFLVFIAFYILYLSVVLGHKWPTSTKAVLQEEEIINTVDRLRWILTLLIFVFSGSVYLLASDLDRWWKISTALIGLLLLILAYQESKKDHKDVCFVKLQYFGLGFFLPAFVLYKMESLIYWYHHFIQS